MGQAEIGKKEEGGYKTYWGKFLYSLCIFLMVTELFLMEVTSAWSPFLIPCGLLMSR